jgi:Protein of unknown function (DUF4058)
VPLRDHFRPPLEDFTSWEGFHGQWPAVLVQHLRKELPPGYVAEPRVHPGSRVEIDVAAFETVGSSRTAKGGSRGGLATVAWSPTRPSLAVETNLPDDDEYEVRIFDLRPGRRLVATIEIVSPTNEDRPEHRNLFVAKCAALLREGIAVSIVDLVTVRRFNLYADLLTILGHVDPNFGETPPYLYAASCRWTRQADPKMLEAWSHELVIGQPLPILPLWLGEDLVVPLDLESSYEQACHDLWIT